MPADTKESVKFSTFCRFNIGVVYIAADPFAFAGDNNASASPGTNSSAEKDFGDFLFQVDTMFESEDIETDPSVFAAGENTLDDAHAPHGGTETEPGAKKDGVENNDHLHADLERDDEDEVLGVTLDTLAAEMFTRTISESYVPLGTVMPSKLFELGAQKVGAAKKKGDKVALDQLADNLLHDVKMCGESALSSSLTHVCTEDADILWYTWRLPGALSGQALRNADFLGDLAFMLHTCDRIVVQFHPLADSASLAHLHDIDLWHCALGEAAKLLSDMDPATLELTRQQRVAAGSMTDGDFWHLSAHVRASRTLYVPVNGTTRYRSDNRNEVAPNQPTDESVKSCNLDAAIVEVYGEEDEANFVHRLGSIGVNFGSHRIVNKTVLPPRTESDYDDLIEVYESMRSAANRMLHAPSLADMESVLGAAIITVIKRVDEKCLCVNESSDDDDGAATDKGAAPKIPSVDDVQKAFRCEQREAEASVIDQLTEMGASPAFVGLALRRLDNSLHETLSVCMSALSARRRAKMHQSIHALAANVDHLHRLRHSFERILKRKDNLKKTGKALLKEIDTFFDSVKGLRDRVTGLNALLDQLEKQAEEVAKMAEKWSPLAMIMIIVAIAVAVFTAGQSIYVAAAAIKTSGAASAAAVAKIMLAVAKVCSMVSTIGSIIEPDNKVFKHLKLISACMSMGASIVEVSELTKESASRVVVEKSKNLALDMLTLADKDGDMRRKAGIVFDLLLIYDDARTGYDGSKQLDRLHALTKTGQLFSSSNSKFSHACNAFDVILAGFGTDGDKKKVEKFASDMSSHLSCMFTLVADCSKNAQYSQLLQFLEVISGVKSVIDTGQEFLAEVDNYDEVVKALEREEKAKREREKREKEECEKEAADKKRREEEKEKKKKKEKRKREEEKAGKESAERGEGDSVFEAIDAEDTDNYVMIDPRREDNEQSDPFEYDELKLLGPYVTESGDEDSAVDGITLMRLGPDHMRPSDVNGDADQLDTSPSGNFLWRVETFGKGVMAGALAGGESELLGMWNTAKVIVTDPVTFVKAAKKQLDELGDQLDKAAWELSDHPKEFLDRQKNKFVADMDKTWKTLIALDEASGRMIGDYLARKAIRRVTAGVKMKVKGKMSNMMKKGGGINTAKAPGANASKKERKKYARKGQVAFEDLPEAERKRVKALLKKDKGRVIMGTKEKPLRDSDIAPGTVKKEWVDRPTKRVPVEKRTDDLRNHKLYHGLEEPDGKRSDIKSKAPITTMPGSKPIKELRGAARERTLNEMELKRTTNPARLQYLTDRNEFLTDHIKKLNDKKK